MAEQLTEREIRQRRRQRLIEEKEKLEMEELEKKMIEIERLRDVINERKTQGSRPHTGSIAHDFSEYMEDTQNRNIVQDVAELGDRDTLHESTRISEDNFEYNEFSFRSELERGEKDLNPSFLKEVEEGHVAKSQKDTGMWKSQAHFIDKDNTVEGILEEKKELRKGRRDSLGVMNRLDTMDYSESARRKVSRLDTRRDLEYLEDDTRLRNVLASSLYDKAHDESLKRETEESMDKLKKQIETEMLKEELLCKEREKQRLKDKERLHLMQTLEELKLRNSKMERDILESERKRVEFDTESELRKARQKYETLFERTKVVEERQDLLKVPVQRIKRETDMSDERRLLHDKMKYEVEKKLRDEMERKEYANMAKRLTQPDRLEQRKAEAKDLIRSIEQLQIKERELRELKSLREGKEDVLPETNEDEIDIEMYIQRLKKEKEKLEGEIVKESTVKEKKETKDQILKETHKVDKAFGKPKLPEFDGTQFEEFKLEVTSLVESKLYTDLILSRAIRNTLTGKARKVLPTLKPSASTDEIMKKLEDIYGNIRSGDSIIHDFYSAKQTKTESCSEWGVRIETLFYQALERGEIEESKKNGKLKERFWRGLYSDQLKMATRSVYESSETFDMLRRKARIEELEMALTTHENKNSEIKESKPIEVTKLCQPIQRVQDTNTKLDELLQKMKNLEFEMKEIKTRQSQQEYKSFGRGFRPYTERSRFGPRGRGYRYRGGDYARKEEQKDNKNEDRTDEKQPTNAPGTDNKPLN